MVLKVTDVFKWLLQYLTVSKNVSFAGEICHIPKPNGKRTYIRKTIIDEAVKAQNNLLLRFFWK